MRPDGLFALRAHPFGVALRAIAIAAAQRCRRTGPLIALGPTPDQILDSQQRLDELTTLLDTVNPWTREIYFAHRCGYSYAEIADDMSIAEITVKRHIARANLSIMKHVEKD